MTRTDQDNLTPQELRHSSTISEECRHYMARFLSLIRESSATKGANEQKSELMSDDELVDFINDGFKLVQRLFNQPSEQIESNITYLKQIISLIDRSYRTIISIYIQKGYAKIKEKKYDEAIVYCQKADFHICHLLANSDLTLEKISCGQEFLLNLNQSGFFYRLDSIFLAACSYHSCENSQYAQKMLIEYESLLNEVRKKFGQEEPYQHYVQQYEELKKNVQKMDAPLALPPKSNSKKKSRRKKSKVKLKQKSNIQGQSLFIETSLPTSSNDSDVSSLKLISQKNTQQNETVLTSSSSVEHKSHDPHYFHEQSELISVPQWDEQIVSAKEKVTELIKEFQVSAFLFGGAMRDECPTDLDIVLFATDELSNEHRKQFIIHIKNLPEVSKIVEYKKRNRSVLKVKFCEVEFDFSWDLGEEFPVSESVALQNHVKMIDFTINGLYQNLRTGHIEDPTGEAAQAKQNKELKTVTSVAESFGRHPERILRAVRLSVKHELRMTPSLCTGLGGRHLFDDINQDRLYFEYKNLFFSGQGVKVYSALKKYNLLNKLFPTLQILKGAQRELIDMVVIRLLSEIDKSVCHAYAIIYMAIHWYDGSKTKLKEPRINLQMGNFPDFNDGVRRDCIEIIERCIIELKSKLTSPNFHVEQTDVSDHTSRIISPIPNRGVPISSRLFGENPSLLVQQSENESARHFLDKDEDCCPVNGG